MLRQVATKRKALISLITGKPIFDKTYWRDPTQEEIDSVEFEAIWRTIKSWDIHVPGAYEGYTGTMGNHVCVILDALKSKNLLKISKELETKRIDLKNW